MGTAKKLIQISIASLMAISIITISKHSLATTLVDVNLDSPPTSENNGGYYTGSRGRIILEVRNGSPSNYFDHVTGSECWGESGGCAKFYGSVSGGGVYRGFNLGSFSGGSTRKNLRYLKKWNRAWSSGNGASNLKGNYLSMGSVFWTQEKAIASAFGRGFQMAQSYAGTLYRIQGNGQSASTCNSAGYECCEHRSNCNLGPGVAEAGPFFFADYDNQWVCIELEMISSGIFRIYIWTQDGKFNGLYMEATNMSPGTPGITGFSGMYFHDSGAASGSYIMVDEVVLSDSFIGAPAGFPSSSSTSSAPEAPSGLRVENPAP